jgi:3-oxoacyl-(acyl-carrier-protein) synthase III
VCRRRRARKAAAHQESKFRAEGLRRCAIPPRPKADAEPATAQPTSSSGRCTPRHDDGRWSAFPASFFPRLDLSVASSRDELEEIVAAHFARHTPNAQQLAERASSGAYKSRTELLRDLIRFLYWTQRYFLTLYTVRPCRWEDRPRGDRSARLPLASALELGQPLVDVVVQAFARLPAGRPGPGETDVLEMLTEPLACVTYDPSALTADPPSVDEALRQTNALALLVSGPTPICEQQTVTEVLQLRDRHPELTALLRQAGAIVREHAGRWGPPAISRLTSLSSSDFVLLAWPRAEHVQHLLETDAEVQASGPLESQRSSPALIRGVGRRRRYTPSRGVILRGIAAVDAELRATNEDIVANAAWHWSPMTAEDIFARTGIRERRYTQRPLDDLAVAAARRVLAQPGCNDVEVGSVVVCSSTNTQLMPSLAARVGNRLGLTELAGVWDVVAACAGLPYGLAQAAHVIEEAECSVLLVLAERFSDKLGTVRSSRMLFGDGAAALMLSPANGAGSDLEVVQTYAGGAYEEVHSVIWPNEHFNNHLTVDGPGARSIVQRYMRQILDDLRWQSRERDSLAPGIDLVIPHQANERMVRDIAEAAGIPAGRLYFNVSRVGNLGGASIPVALYDAIRDETIAEETRVLAPAFAAGALAGFALLTIRQPIISAIAQENGSRRRCAFGRDERG